MAIRRRTVEEIVTKLREADVGLPRVRLSDRSLGGWEHNPKDCCFLAGAPKGGLLAA